MTRCSMDMESQLLLGVSLVIPGISIIAARERLLRSGEKHGNLSHTWTWPSHAALKKGLCVCMKDGEKGFGDVVE